jgi:lipopolysaccharide transport system permease protein
MNSPAMLLVRLRPATGWRALDLVEIWRFRDLLLAFAVRDLKLRYRQTALGVAWVVLQPLVAAGIFSFVFGRVLKVDAGGYPYFVFCYAGLLAWNVFNATLTKAGGCLVQNAGLISKIYFPRLVLPLSAIFSTLVDFIITLAMFGVMLIVCRIAPGPAVFTMPLWLLLTLMLATGCALYTSALMVKYRDVQYILPVLTQFLFYASPVNYPLSKVPLQYRCFYDLNPLVGTIDAFRWSILGGAGPDWMAVAYSAAFAVVALFAGGFAFKKMEREFADVI